MSTKIEKITVKHRPRVDVKELAMEPQDNWMRFDRVLVELVEQLDCKTRLEVEFWDEWGISKEVNGRIHTYLPRFVEKGRVTVRNGDGVVHSFDRFGESR